MQSVSFARSSQNEPVAASERFEHLRTSRQLKPDDHTISYRTITAGNWGGMRLGSETCTGSVTIFPAPEVILSAT